MKNRKVRLVYIPRLKEEVGMKILSTPRMERCIGCHSCSLACARLVHSSFLG